jgi:hypothetical protein
MQTGLFTRFYPVDLSLFQVVGLMARYNFQFKPQLLQQPALVGRSKVLTQSFSIA